MAAAGGLAAYVHVSGSFGSTLRPAGRHLRAAGVVAAVRHRALLRRRGLRAARGAARRAARSGVRRPGPPARPASPTRTRAADPPVTVSAWTPRPGTTATPPPSWSGRRPRTSSSRPSSPTSRRAARSTSPPARAATRSGWPAAAGRSPPSTSRRSASTRAGALAGDDLASTGCAPTRPTWRREPAVRPGAGRLPPARRPPSAARPCGRLRGAARRRHVPAGRPRLDQPHRGHRRPAGPGGADDRRGRARRPRRRAFEVPRRAGRAPRRAGSRRRPRPTPGTAWSGRLVPSAPGAGRVRPSWRRLCRRAAGPGSPGAIRVAVDAGVLGRLRLAQLLDQAEPEHDHGERSAAGRSRTPIQPAFTSSSSGILSASAHEQVGDGHQDGSDGHGASLSGGVGDAGEQVVLGDRAVDVAASPARSPRSARPRPGARAGSRTRSRPGRSASRARAAPGRGPRSSRRTAPGW